MRPLYEPEPSPYQGPHVEVYFRHGKSFKVPRAVVAQCPKFPPQFNDEIHVDNVSEDVGHVLIHHLFARTYQCLPPKASSDREKLIAEFAIAASAYVAARTYELHLLADQAKGEMERLGDGLSPFAVMTALNNAYPNPGTDDEWIANYVKSRVESLLNGSSPVLEPDIQDDTRRNVSITEILLKALIEIHYSGSKKSAVAMPPESGPPGQPLPAEVAQSPEPAQPTVVENGSWSDEPEVAAATYHEPEPVPTPLEHNGLYETVASQPTPQGPEPEVDILSTAVMPSKKKPKKKKRTVLVDPELELEH